MGIEYFKPDEFVDFMKEKGWRAICFQFKSLGEEYRGLPATPILSLAEIFGLLYHHITCICIPRIDLFRDDRYLIPGLCVLQRLGYTIAVTLE